MDRHLTAGSTKPKNKTVIQLEHRIFLVLLLVGMVLSFLSTLANVIYATPAFRIMSPLFIFLILSFCFWYCVTYEQFNKPMLAISFLIPLLVVPLLWFAHGGLAGGFPFFIPYFSVVLLSVHKGAKGWFFMILLAVVLSGLTQLDLSESSWIRDIPGPEVNRYSNVFGLIGSTFSTILLFQVYSKSYVLERRRVEKMAGALEEANKELQMMACQDVLTGLSNRRDAMEKLKYQIRLSIRNHNPFSIVMFDVDHFKHFNDQHGHECGDFVLQAVSNLLESMKREQDSAVRWGGEEFMMILPDTDLKGGIVLAEKIRKLIQEETFFYYGNSHRITITSGVTVFDHRSYEIEEYIRRADIALYWGKEQGRNQVNAYTDKLLTIDEAMLQ